MTELGDIYDGPVPMSWHPIREHDLTKETYCHTCGFWEPRWADGRVCADCGHAFLDADYIARYARHMEHMGYEPVAPDQCPFCAGELQ